MTPDPTTPESSETHQSGSSGRDLRGRSPLRCGLRCDDVPPYLSAVARYLPTRPPGPRLLERLRRFVGADNAEEADRSDRLLRDPAIRDYQPELAPRATNTRDHRLGDGW